MMAATGQGTTLAERKLRAGKRLIIGFDGTEISADSEALIRRIQPAGFVLFARNVVEPKQVAELNRALTSLIREDIPLMTVDQEGGRVQRIRAPATVWPSMREVGCAGQFTRALAAAQGRELRAMGFNLNFAPVADVDSNPDNPVIGDRSFGTEPADVAAHVAAYIEGLQSEGVLACAKHFPGHGDTDLDSHLALPLVPHTMERLKQVELPPFQAAIQAGVASVMTAHVVFPALEATWPSTLSPEIQRDLLRHQLGFGKILFTDDLEMKAVLDRYPLGDQVERSFRATVDLMLVCHTADLQMAFYEEMVRQQETAAPIEILAKQSFERLRRTKLMLGKSLDPVDLSVVGCDAHQRLADDVRARGANS